MPSGLTRGAARRKAQAYGVRVPFGIAAGAFRAASPGHVLQTLIGAVVYHFASGEFGEGLTGAPLFSSDAVRRRKDEVKQLLLCGLSAPPAPASPQGDRS